MVKQITMRVVAIQGDKVSLKQTNHGITSVSLCKRSPYFKSSNFKVGKVFSLTLSPVKN